MIAPRKAHEVPLLVQLALLLAIHAASATERSAPSKKFLQQQYRGWSGLSFSCAPSPENEANKALCEWARQKFRLLATSVREPVVLTGVLSFDRYTDKHRAGLRDALEVSLTLISTDTGLAGRLAAGAFYSNAVNQNGRGPELDPRAATIVMWERTFLASGPREDAQVRQILETNMMDFISEFSEGRRE